MTSAIVKHEPMSLVDLQSTAKLLAASGYFTNVANEQAVAQLAVKILAGQEMGYAPFASVNGIHVVQGKPQVSANLMAAAVKGHPKYDYRVLKMSDAEVAIEFFEGGQSIGVSTFTMEDARKAKTQNTDKFPRNMLFARAMSNGVRWYCPDVFNGNVVYTPEEFDVEGESVRVVDQTAGEITQQCGHLEGDEPDYLPAPIEEWLAAANPAAAAKAWAVFCGAQPNEHAARESLKKIVDGQFGGKFHTGNREAVLTAFYFRQQDHLAGIAEYIDVEQSEPVAA